MKQLLFLTLMLCTMSCASSLIYSPSITPTAKPLKPKQLVVQSSVELFPETRPHRVEGRKLSPGFTGNVGVGLNKNISLRLKGWSDFELDRIAASFSAIITKELSQNSRLLFIPSFGIALEIEGGGYGLSQSIIYQKNLSNTVHLYGGSGLILATEGSNQIENENGDYRSPSGAALTGNLGCGIILFNHFELNLEVNPIFQFNNFDQNRHFIAAPSFSIAVPLNKKVKKLSPYQEFIEKRSKT